MADSPDWRERALFAERRSERQAARAGRFKAERDQSRAEVERLRDVIRRLIYHAGPITPDTPCRCGSTQPAHYCDYAMQAERDALKLVPDA